MKMITTDNYEALLLQYHEGLLDEGQQREVETFLREHPDIEQEYRLYYSDEPIVTPPDVQYQYKDALKRHPVRALVWWRWGAAACIAVLFATAVLLRSPSQTGIGTVSTPTGYIASAKPATAIEPTESDSPSVQPRVVAHPIAEMKRNAINEPLATKPASLPAEAVPVEHLEPATSAQPQLCESDRLVVYGCRVENRQDLVASPEHKETCHNLACRLIATGQKIGML
jgi:hypothetical protein